MEGREIVALLLMAVLVAGGHAETVGGQLTPTFYATSCPNVDVIVRNALVAAMNQSQIVGPSVLRIFAHDCFVNGCDASIMLEDAPGLPAVERDASDNISLQSVAFDTINQIKAAVEAQCPGVVSCSDLLSLASEDVVNLMGGPSWPVPLGRRDGVNSTASSVISHLPGSNMNLSRLSTIFQGLGLTVHDLVALSGAHTVGFAHCGEFTDRLYDFHNVTGAVDPSLSVTYASTLKGVCPNGNASITTVQSLDVQTAAQFDNMYYQGLQKAEGLLFSDQELYVSNATAAQVNIYANNMTIFFNDFVTSMLAFSRVGVLTGTQGEIRTNCSAVNKKSVNSSSPVPSPIPGPVPNPVPVKPPPPPAAVIPASPPPPPQHLIMPPPPPLVVTPPAVPLPPVAVQPSPPPPIVILPSPPPPVVILPSPPPPVAILPSPPPPIVIFPSPPPPAIRPLPVSPPPPALVPPAGRG